MNKIEYEKFYNYITKNKISCECGHKIFLYKKDKLICSWCGRYVFKNKRIEFKYRIKEKLNERY